MHEPQTKQISTANVGKTVETLCFDKNEFMKTNFSVDEFLHKNRNVSSLELLRDNLGLYLKGLRSSMIDLINEDYADFVSLSANLVGLDQSIDTIQKPLEQFRDEIESIQSLIKESETEIREHLEHKRQLRELKRNLQSLKKVYVVIRKLEDLLAHQLSADLRAVDLERAALELIQLKFNEKFCSEYLSEQEKQQINKLELSVLEKLRTHFNAALKSATSTCSEQLERCLRIYITLDACHIAESVFRTDAVASYMSHTISEHCLQNSPQGLAGIYSKILNFISLHMTDLLRLTQYTDKLRGFNFLVNSFWADVEMRLETHMSSIFAPGNSEVFYTKYKCTRDFLLKIEELLANEQSIKLFRQHKQTKSFQARWNLPVYFQICFQEIAGQFEAVLEPLLRDDYLIQANVKGEFQLTPFKSAHKAIERCWTEGVYLSEVFPKFYKLTVQIILRLSRWITDVLKLTSGNANKKIDSSIKLDKTNMLIALHVDIQKFTEILPEIQQTVYQSVPSDKQSSILNDTIIKSFSDLHQTLSTHLIAIQNTLVSTLITESGLENIRQVNDLPRLYRKTNRDVPTRCSAYIEQMLRPLKAFAEQQNSQLGQDIVEEVLAQVFSKITTDYFVAVSEVLTSVQKTEESLRRLRNLKSGSTLAPTNSNAAISDDDKIRLQLRVDVTAWTNELAKLNFMSTQIEKLLDLNNVVEESIKTKDASST